MRAADISGITLNLDSLEMESHVRQAFLSAQAMAGSRPVNASDLLQAAVAVGRSGPSEAFAYLTELLEIDARPPERAAAKAPIVTVTAPMARSFDIARQIIGSDTMWGRDYVAMVLLAKDDTLHGLATDENRTPDWLRDEWFRFVVRSDRDYHRDRAAWTAWWEAAGLHPPANEPDASAVTPAYLFTWNPERFDKAKIREHVVEQESSGSTVMGWSTGNRTQVEVGARTYLLRQVEDPVGIVGIGEVIGSVEEAPHWDLKKREKGATYNWVPVRWRELSTEPLLSVDALVSATGEEKLWHSRSGGVKIAPEIAARIDELMPEKPGPEPSDALRFAQTLSDLDHSNDWIGIRSDVEALSTLVSINRVEPPLSIAIFGDWGSGKTFLMRKMQERVMLLEEVGREQLAARAATSDPPDSETDAPRYCSSILQIEFNAWHYTESNLWASLVNQIFEKLHDRLVGSFAEDATESDEQREKTVERLFEEFTTAQAAKRELEAQVNRVSAEVQHANHAAEVAKQQVKTAQEELAKAVGQSAWTRLQRAIADDEARAARLTDVGKALEQFGFSTDSASLQTIHDTVIRFRSASGRSREILGSLLSTSKGVQRALLLAVVTLLAAAIAYFFDAAILAAGTVLASAIAWVAEKAADARVWLDRIQSFDDWLTQLKEEEDSRIASEIARNQAVFDEKKEDLAAVQHQLREAETREANARADLQKLTARDRMRRFVDGRVTAETYARHLGLVSLIRRDFEDLSDFMYRDRQPGEARLVQRIEDTIREAIPTVERIILYIDDLDRCQPERVVEILEAIHLLLSFRLFIVVVAVDPRWVLQSLKIRYPYLAETVVEDGGGTGSQNGLIEDLAQPSHKRASATAHDYLEKIFNIPFWVKPMSPRACESLVAGYLGFSEATPPHHLDTDDGTGADRRFDPIVVGHTANESKVTDRPMPLPSTPALGKQTPVPPSQETLQRVAQERLSAKKQIENVSIGEDEQQLIRDLAPHLGNSPRRIKRFANTYRLFKSGLEPGETARFASKGDVTKDYRLVLVLLSIVTGAPNIAPNIFARVFDDRANLDLDEIAAAIGKQAPAADPFEIANAVGALELLREANVGSNSIERWLPRVMRFAFRLVPVDATSSPSR